MFCHPDWRHCTLVIYPSTCLPMLSQFPPVSSRDWNFSSLVWHSSLVLISFLELVPVPLLHQFREWIETCVWVHSIIPFCYQYRQFFTHQSMKRAENEKINKNNASYRHATIPNKNYTSNFQLGLLKTPIKIDFYR